MQVYGARYAVNLPYSSEIGAYTTICSEHNLRECYYALQRSSLQGNTFHATMIASVTFKKNISHCMQLRYQMLLENQNVC
jgi:hypothetical protein